LSASQRPNLTEETPKQNPHERAKEARAKAEAASTDVERTKWLEIAETWDKLATGGIAQLSREPVTNGKARN
jgi:hypothetical protein